MRGQKAYISVGVYADPIFDEEGEEVGQEEYVLIDEVFVPRHQRRQGKARKMLREVIADSGKRYPNKSIKIIAAPFDDEVCDMHSLVAFYESEGFSVEDADGHGVIMSYK